jgi:hypothetical protein
MRANFAPTLWTGAPAADQVVEHAWFPGVHADIAGGYKENGLSNAALFWMIEKAEACGAAFNGQMVDQIRPNSRGVLHNSLSCVFSLRNSQPRPFPQVSAKGKGPTWQIVHATILDRQRNPPIEQAPYRPTRALEVGQSITGQVFAHQYWNSTELYLEAGGRYEFRADGQWQDAHYTTDPEGMQGDSFIC